MATWSVNYWPWEGVTVCFNEAELQKLYAADDIASGVAALLALSHDPAVVAAGIVIAAYLQSEKGAAEAVDRGAGDCFFVPWGAIATQQWWAVIPSAQPVPPVSPGHHVEVFWVDSAGNISSTWADDNVDGGSWHQPFNVALTGSRADSPLVAVSRHPGHVEVFWVDSAGNISSTWADDNVDGGSWHQPFNVALTGSRADSPLVAVSRS